MNRATIIVLLVVAALVVVAVRALGKDKHSRCDSGENGCSGCTVDCPLRRRG